MELLIIKDILLGLLITFLAINAAAIITLAYYLHKTLGEMEKDRVELVAAEGTQADDAGSLHNRLDI